MTDQPSNNLPEKDNDENRPYPNSGLIPISGRDVTITFNVKHILEFEDNAILDPDELRKGMVPIPQEPTA